MTATNCKFIRELASHDASNVLPPGTLAIARVKKTTHLVMLKYPSVWKHPPPPQLSYGLVLLDSPELSHGSCAASDVSVVLAKPAVMLPAQPESAQQCGMASTALDLLRQLPWRKKDKLIRIAGELGIGSSDACLSK